MQRILEYIKTLSLTQQLLMLIVFFVSFFSIFFFVYVNGSVTAAIQSEIYQTLDHTQNTIDLTLGYTQLPKTINGVSVYELEIMNNTLIIPSDENNPISQKEAANILEQCNYLLEGSKERIHGKFDNAYDGLDSFYSIYLTDDHRLLLARTYSNNMRKLESILINSLVYIIVIVVGFFFVILALWVLTLIHPLNLMKNYTEKIKAGEDDAVLNVNRSDEIGELADALVSMHKELKKQEKTKEEMIHNISHDLKTPIATIKSYGESIKDGIYPYGTLDNSVDVILENANRLESKVHSLLYMNRLEYLISNTSSKDKTNMKEIIEIVVKNTQLIKPEINIITSLDEIYFQGNSEPWRVAVENIVENALRYASGKIEIELKEGELSISNDGPCMDDDRIETLFKPFEKGAGGKFGLGLSIVSKVVHANGYDVVGENLTQGVVFRIFKKKCKNNRYKVRG